MASFSSSNSSSSALSTTRTTTDAFSRLLVFYANYYPEKLNSNDLQKIVNKYRSKPGSLLIRDLSKKYITITLPEEVMFSEVSRTCKLFDVPEAYREILPSIPVGFEYIDIFDPRQDTFDPERCLQEKRLIISVAKCPPIDNIGKLKYFVTQNAMSIQSSELLSHATKVLGKTTNPRHSRESKYVKINPITQITLDAIGVDKAATETPMQLLKDIMEQQTFARVIVRKHSGIRGRLDGKLICFDKHFNMVLTDVEEVYTPPRSIATQMDQDMDGQVVPDTLTRHLPQVFIRGDNVVLVCRCPAAPACIDKGNLRNSKRMKV